MSKAKIIDLEEKIKKLTQEKKDLENKRNIEVASLIAKVGINDIDDELLVGALVSIKESITNKNPVLEVWLEAGRKFLKRKPKIIADNN
jgi:seryl-tRNA synthetase